MISIILFLVVLVVLLIDRNDASSPGTLSYCNIGPNYKYGKGSSVMSWVEAPINADFYTVRTADGANTANDPTSYVPDKWMPIHIRVNDLRRKFIGLVMYAINSGDDNKKVGEWKINPTDPYRLPTACGGQAVTHSDANIKPMHSVIYFRAPKGTGTVTFRVMIKQGEQGKGNFFYPTKVLTLSEGAVQTSAPKVYLSKAGESCDNACGTAGLVCDLQQTVALSSASSLTTATWGEVSCAYPAIAGCSATVPMQSTNNNYCYFKNTACQSSQQPAATSCGAKADGISRICACTNSVTIDSSTGNSGPSNKGSSSTGTTTISGSSTGLYPGGKSSTGSNGSNSKSSTGSNGSNSTGRQGSTGSSGSDVDDSSSTGDEIWWPAGDDDYSSTGRRGAASSASNSRPLFIVPLLTFLFHSTRSSTTFLLLSLLSLFLFISPSSVSAHNWVHSPSRALVASVSKPCQARIGNQPHIQVGKGQTFQMEWSVGHGDFWWAMNYYFVIIKAEDYDQLNFITETEMEKYLEEAPQASVLTGNSWLKRHVWQNKDGVPPSKYFRAQAPTNPSDPYYIERDSVMIQKETFPGPADKWTVVAFLDNCTALDKRAAYTNGKWPFIQSVHRFRNPLYEHSIFAHQWSIANFQIPSSMPAGDYIAYFTWAGYRDCVDIDVRDTTVQNRYGLVPTSNTPKVYVKMEHCEFSNVQEASTPCTKVPANGDISACINACSTSYCRAVQVARVKNPAGTLPFTENIPWTPYDYTKYPNGCGAVTVHDRALAGCTGNAQNCDKTKLGTLQDSDYICYGLNPFRDENIQVAEDYEFGTESQDPKFYSTCYLKMNDEGFLSRPAITPSKLAWVAGDKCVQCSTRNSASSKSLNVITDWYPAVTDICTNCDEPTK